MTFNFPFEEIDAAFLETLRADGVREGRQLDYKETLPGTSDEDKREFLSDVTSFANAAGGDLIFGLTERRDAGKPTGEIENIIGLPGLNVDAEQLRLEALIRDGVAPRMPPVSFHEIRRNSESSCLLIRVPRSWAGLHMVTYKNLSRFYSRTSAGKYQLDVHEIRTGFVAAEMAVERLQRFKAERVTRMLALEAPIPISDGPKLVFHALPLNTSDNLWARVCAIKQEEIALPLPVIGATPSMWRFNLDGFVVHTLHNDLRRQCYTQLFRDGGIEAVSGTAIQRDAQRGGFFAWGMEQLIIGALSACVKVWQNFGVTHPLLVGLTLSGVKNWKVLRNPYDYWESDAVLDRDIVSPPEVIVSDLAIPADIVLRPLFDFVWNGGGWPGSPNYKDGRWFSLAEARDRERATS